MAGEKSSEDKSVLSSKEQVKLSVVEWVLFGKLRSTFPKVK
jgi:hypothetical protein